MQAMITTAFLLGVLGSAHCIGMCGPLALAVPSPKHSFAARLGSALAMNGGRILTYALIGAGFGLFGRGLQLAGLQQVVSITLGVVIILGLLLPRVFHSMGVGRVAGTFVMRAQGLMAKQLRRTSPEGLFFTGMLNGLLPCGMVYLAAAGALAQDGWLEGSLFMAIFGLGTWPALIGLKVSGSYAGPGLRSVLRKAAPYAYAIMGVFFILRGLDLGIPYISPDLPEVNSVEQVCAPHTIP
jgi:sulfite exporter TauE/SafE